MFAPRKVKSTTISRYRLDNSSLPLSTASLFPFAVSTGLRSFLHAPIPVVVVFYYECGFGNFFDVRVRSFADSVPPTSITFASPVPCFSPSCTCTASRVKCNQRTPARRAGIAPATASEDARTEDRGLVVANLNFQQEEVPLPPIITDRS